MYTPFVFSVIFYVFTALLVVAVVIDSYTKKQLLAINGNRGYFYLIPLFLVILIGFRPVGITGFMDSEMYREFFDIARVEGISPMPNKDIVFGYLILLTSYITNERGFFVICSLLSVGLLVLVSKRISKSYWILFFICYLASLYYWNYNVVGFRQGIASLLFLYALFVQNKWWKYLLLFLAFGTHFSLGLPIMVYLISMLVSKVDKKSYWVWGLSIPVSYFFGIKIEYVVAKFIPDERARYFIENMKEQVFRWDMVTYSLIIIAISYYFIFIEKIKDLTYHRIVNIFIFSNTLFLFLVRVNHVQRFAYLSWFLASLVVFYPFFISDGERLKNKYRVFSLTLSAFFIFVLIQFIRLNFF